MTTASMPLSLKERIIYFALLTRFDKPIGFFLLMWPMLWALWIAGEGFPDSYVTLVFVVGVIMMRAAGCIINDYADRELDTKVSRTQFRPLASGKLRPRSAIILFVVICLLAFAMVLTLNWLTVGLSFAAVVLAVIYPYMKRHTYMPQAFLGLAFGWAVPMAFAAQTGTLPDIAWLLLTATVLWATAYDTMYAMVDRDDDLKAGIKSTAILFGEGDVIIISMIQTIFIITLLIVGNKLELSWSYYAGIMLASTLMVYQYFLIREREPDQCFRAFLNNNWVGAAIFLGVVGHYLLPKM